jgi:hypothetical protein
MGEYWLPSLTEITYTKYSFTVDKPEAKIKSNVYLPDYLIT